MKFPTEPRSFVSCLRALNVSCAEEAQLALLQRLVAEVDLQSVGRTGGGKAYDVEEVHEAIQAMRERYGLKNNQATTQILRLPVVPPKPWPISATKVETPNAAARARKFKDEEEKATEETSDEDVPAEETGLLIIRYLQLIDDVLVSPAGKCLRLLVEAIGRPADAVDKAVVHLEHLGVIEVTRIPRIGAVAIDLVDAERYRPPAVVKSNFKKGKSRAVQQAASDDLMNRIEKYIWDHYAGEMYSEEGACAQVLADALGVPRQQITDGINRLKKTGRLEPPVAKPGTGTFLLRFKDCKLPRQEIVFLER